MEKLQQLLSKRSPRDKTRRSNDADPTVDTLFDSFSESREGSAHGPAAKQAAEEGKGSLYQLLTQAATSLSDPGLSSSGKYNTEAAQGDSTGPEKGSNPQCSEISAGNPPVLTRVRSRAGSSQAAEAPDEPTVGTLPAFSRLQAPPGRQVATQSGVGTAPAAGSRPSLRLRQPEQEGSAPDVNRVSKSSASGMTPSSLQGSRNGEKADWDSAQETSDTASEHVSTTGLPERKGGSWASASCLGSLRSSTQAPRSNSVLTEDADMPREVYFESFGTGGKHPCARWGHASAVHGDRLFVFGGAGRGWLKDCFVYHSGRGAWAQVPSGKDSPPATYSAAACASHGKIFLFGGKQNQKHCRRLYSLDPGTLEWKSHKDSTSAPPACAGHTMTAVGRRGAYVFGGEGRKLSNAVHALDPETLAWSKVNTLGAVPPARQSHTAVWDGADSLIVYGGNHAEKLLSDVRVLSLSTGFWSEASCRGSLPPPRHSHSAVMLGANLMLVWGGCGDRGAVLNDAYLLNTTSFAWQELKSIGSPPTGRYCHTCNVVGKRAIVFGGTDANQPFDSLVGISTDFGKQLGTLAASLSEMAGSALRAEDRSELVRMQLGNHLRQRHAQDTSRVAVARAEIAERLFEQERQRNSQLAAELQHAKMLLKEEETARKREALQHSRSVALLQRAKDMEMHRANEVHSRLRAAITTIQRQDGEAAVVDGYKTMYDCLVAERGALVEMTVDLEYQNKVLTERLVELEGRATSSGSPPSRLSEPPDLWEVEFDRREKLHLNEK